MRLTAGTARRNYRHRDETDDDDDDYIAPYGRNFRGAGGKSNSDQCSVKAWVNKKSYKYGLKKQTESR